MQLGDGIIVGFKIGWYSFCEHNGCSDPPEQGLMANTVSSTRTGFWGFGLGHIGGRAHAHTHLVSTMAAAIHQSRPTMANTVLSTKVLPWAKHITRQLMKSDTDPTEYA